MELLKDVGVENVSDCSLNILRTIAKTRALITLDDVLASDNVWLVWLILESGAIIDPDTFQTACAEGRTDIVRVFLAPERGVDSAVMDRAFQLASKHGHTEIVRSLLAPEREVNPATHDNWALQNACYHGHTEIVRLFLDLPLERGVNPAAFDNLALRIATQQKKNGNRSFAP